MNKIIVDHIIFSLHIQGNKIDKVGEQYIEFCRKIIDGGASIVYCHSPHHVLPFEEYKTKLGRKGYIFYSLGSFIDDYYIDEYRDDLAILPQLEITKTKVINYAI